MAHFKMATAKRLWAEYLEEESRMDQFYDRVDEVDELLRLDWDLPENNPNISESAS